MIEFRNVRKIYRNGTVALDGINLRIDDGEFVFIVGHSGAGKSTLTKLLLREEKVSSGKLLVDGVNIARMPRYRVPYYRRTMGVVFQDFRLFKHMTVYDNVAFAMRVIGTPSKVIRRRVPTLLKLVGLLEKAKCLPEELSGGEQQRVALARAIANNPKVLIADEPTGNIDPKMSLEIMNLLLRIHQKGKTVIVVTHAKELVDQLNERIVVLQDGHVEQDRKGGGMFGNES